MPKTIRNQKKKEKIKENKNHTHKHNSYQKCNYNLISYFLNCKFKK